jgi:general secretion pathway protein E
MGRTETIDTMDAKMNHVLSEREAAQWLGISASRLREWAQVNGIFPTRKRLFFFQKRLYPLDFLQNIVQSTQTEPIGDAPTQADTVAKPLSLSEAMEEILRNTVPPDGESESEMETAPVVRMCNAIIVQAINESASDIQIEPFARHMRVRFRVNGLWQECTVIPNHIKSALTNRYKVMAEIPYFRKTPQSGSISIRYGDKSHDISLIFAPTLYGDSIHMSLATIPEYVPFPKLGMSATYERELYHICVNKKGFIVVFGGIGQGKSKVRDTLLNNINDISKNIVILQEASERRIITGITHLLYGKSSPNTFSEVFTAALRMRPDVIALDIVDAETAEAAVSAAEKGVQVIGTITATTFEHCQRILEQAGIDKARQKAVFSGAVGTRLVPKQPKEDATIGMEGVGLLGVYEVWQEYDDPALLFEDDISLKRMEGLIA